jgi:signal peptidase II
VFNYADACVSVGVISMLLFCRKDLDDLSTSFSTKHNKKNPVTEEDK